MKEMYLKIFHGNACINVIKLFNNQSKRNVYLYDIMLFTHYISSLENRWMDNSAPGTFGDDQ